MKLDKAWSDAVRHFAQAGTLIVPATEMRLCSWSGEREVRQSEYVSLMGSLPFAPVLPGAARLVENITWQAARNYCAALTAQQTAARCRAAKRASPSCATPTATAR